MATISLCMIVKNEEQVLKRCLDSIYDLVDEIIIVDTGSGDSTKSIAAEYTDKIYDFEWIHDFSAARNYSFSKCSMDYIYVADADEYLDEANRMQFKLLKDNIFPEIEIVQMMYETISHDTVLNIHREYRPKLYKRLREFTWIDPVHETVRLDPLVFDSDIVVTHAPLSNHSKRDFSIFEKAIERDGILSENVSHMYAIELYKCGDLSDLNKGFSYFHDLKKDTYESLKIDSTIICAKAMRLSAAAFSGEADELFTEYINQVLDSPLSCSELYFEAGQYYLANKDYIQAAQMFNNAVYDSEPALDIHAGGDNALSLLIESCERVISDYEEYKEKNGADEEMDKLTTCYRELLKKYKLDLNDWALPTESVTN